MAAARLNEVLREYHVEADIDEAVAEYLVNAASDGNLASGELLELLTCYVPGLAEIRDTQHVLDRIIQLCEAQEDPAADENLTESLHAPPGSSASPDSTPPNDENRPQHEDVAFLCSLVPEIDEPIIEYVFVHVSARERDHAAQYLIENNCPEGISSMRSAMVSLNANDVCVVAVLWSHHVAGLCCCRKRTKRNSEQTLLPKQNANVR